MNTQFSYPLYVLGRENDYVTIQGNALLVFTEDWIANAHLTGNSISAVVVRIRSSDDLRHFLSELPPGITNLAVNAPIDSKEFVRLSGMADLREFSEFPSNRDMESYEESLLLALTQQDEVEQELAWSLGSPDRGIADLLARRKAERRSRLTRRLRRVFGQVRIATQGSIGAGVSASLLAAVQGAGPMDCLRHLGGGLCGGAGAFVFAWLFVFMPQVKAELFHEAFGTGPESDDSLTTWPTLIATFAALLGAVYWAAVGLGGAAFTTESALWASTGATAAIVVGLVTRRTAKREAGPA